MTATASPLLEGLNERGEVLRERVKVVTEESLKLDQSPQGNSRTGRHASVVSLVLAARKRDIF